jgi:hypothetical protein
LIHHNFTLLQAAEADSFFLGVLQIGTDGLRNAFGREAHLGYCVVEVFVCYLSG